VMGYRFADNPSYSSLLLIDVLDATPRLEAMGCRCADNPSYSYLFHSSPYQMLALPQSGEYSPNFT
jgi:hypothetical protein